MTVGEGSAKKYNQLNRQSLTYIHMHPQGNHIIEFL